MYDPCERIWLSIGDSDRLDRLISDRLDKMTGWIV
jgi:hypothetical protein